MTHVIDPTRTARSWLALAALALAAGLTLAPARAAAPAAPATLAERLDPLLAAVSGASEPFTLSATLDVPIGGRVQQVDVELARFDRATFDLELTHADYALHLARRSDLTALALPRHRVVFLGRGDVDPDDHLAPEGIVRRLVSPASQASAYLPLTETHDPATVARLLTGLLNVRFDPQTATGSAGQSTFAFAGDRQRPELAVTLGETRLTLSLGAAGRPGAADQWPGYEVVELERRELERHLARGVRRAGEILAPAPQLTAPVQGPKRVDHGELRWIDGQRIVLLAGTPEEIGRAHGRLLATEVQRCVDSVLHTFGTIEMIRSGRWFRHDLEAAYARLEPYIPDDHKRETLAMAEAAGIDPHVATITNVFPELFHCSGFALFGSATLDGKLYHGRVLDYMTMIGLQDAATTFIVAVDGKIPFANVGYAGFIGSVSGMNAQAISLGEMGGRGQGQWDGTPMATLMRRALEECTTLDEVIHLWQRSPRTCEYFYVFADGKSNRAVGVAAVPESVELVWPGESHPRLGEGIPDAVVLSSGTRLETLRQRVVERHGEVDAEAALWLMSRPVAMESNLHNVLFVPADGVLYVAQASHRQPAAERPYVRLDLHRLLDDLPRR